MPGAVKEAKAQEELYVAVGGFELQQPHPLGWRTGWGKG